MRSRVGGIFRRLRLVANVQVKNCLRASTHSLGETIFGCIFFSD